MTVPIGPAFVGGACGARWRLPRHLRACCGGLPRTQPVEDRVRTAMTLAVVAATVALSGCSGGDEEGYLDRLNRAGVAEHFDGDDEAVESAEAVCDLRGNGVPESTMIASLLERGLDEDEAAIVVEAAVAAYCPEEG